MKNDSDIKRDVEAELHWDPRIDATDIAVQVKDGIVSLTGFVHAVGEKYNAEVISKRVAGVHAVANDIQIKRPRLGERSDPELARDAVHALKLQVPEEWENISVVVKDGWVTLDGAVQWHFARRRAEAAIRHLREVRGISNLIVVKPTTLAKDIKHQIEDAFRRNAEIDAGRVQVAIEDGAVILSGTVRSWTEHDEAQRAAWNAPGVTHVDNQLRIGN